MSSPEKLPDELKFRVGDIVKMVQLKSKKKWNGKLATIIGPYHTEKKRWPISINFDDKAHALLQTKNLRIHSQGKNWVIDATSPIQRLNLLLKAYTRDLEAFAQLTRRQQKIFDDQFNYEMHDNIVCNGLTEFDHQLNALKSNIVKLCEQQNEHVEKFLMDDTQVVAINDDLTQFNVVVAIKIGNNNVWQRTSQVTLDAKSKLVCSAKLLSMQVVPDPKLNKDKKGDTDSKSDSKTDNNDNDTQVSNDNLVNAINQNKT